MIEYKEKVPTSIEYNYLTNVVLLLLSDNASYINGENLNVNGGSLLK